MTEARSKKDVAAGDIIRVLPAATGDAAQYIGKLVLVSSIDCYGDPQYESEDNGELFLTSCEWEPAGRADTERDSVKIGDRVLILPNSTGEAGNYIGRVVRIAGVWSLPYFAIDDGDNAILSPSEWVFVESLIADTEPFGPELIDVYAVADKLAELAPPRRAAPERRPVVGDLIRVLPDATSTASYYIGETVEVTEVDPDGDPWIDDWKHGSGAAALVAGEWEFVRIET